jgi:hypothetical protein
MLPGGSDELRFVLPVAKRPRMARTTRLLLVLMTLAASGVLAAAIWIHPYDAAGQPQSHSTHTQLGMPPCSMMVMLGKPCPACGMTTSFALLAHGDPGPSLRANWVGTLMAAATFAFIPWGAVSAIRGRLLAIRNGEAALTIAVGLTLTLMLLRWAGVLLL